MPSDDNIVNDWIEVEGEKFRLVIDGSLREEAGRFDIVARIVDGANDQDVTVVSFESTITNPIDVIAIIVVAAKLYGLCVVGSLIGSLGKAIYQEYNNSRTARPGLPVPERAVDVYHRIKGKHSDLKGEAVKALAGCLPKAAG